jgi:CheY-like chemotaxis protein
MNAGTRFNLLLTHERPHGGEHWTAQLPRLLGPQGVGSYVVSTGRDAIDVAERTPIHAAVIDLGTPPGEGHDWAMGPGPASAGPGGLWLLKLLLRLPNRPPVVLLRKPAYSRRQAERLLREALSLGAFSVLQKPVQMEELLAVFQRLVDRKYSGAWPGPSRASAPKDPFTFRSGSTDQPL